MGITHSDRPATEIVAARPTLLGGVTLSKVSWSAIFAGIILVLAVEILLDVLGAGFGFRAVHPGVNASGLGIGAGIWWFVSTIIAFLFGGYVAARLAGVAHRWDGVLHGLVIWGGVALIAVYLLTSAVGGMIGGAFSVLGGSISAVGGAVKAAAPQVENIAGINSKAVEQQVSNLLQTTPQNPGAMSHEQAIKAIGQAIPDLLAGGAKGTAARNRISDIVAAQANISPQDAQKRVNEAERRLTGLKNEAVATATQAAHTVAAAASRISFMMFIMLLVGAISAGVGGALASPRRVLLATRSPPLADDVI